MVDHEELIEFYEFLAEAKEERADIVCLECQEMGHDMLSFECDDNEHRKYTLSGTHDSPGIQNFVRCLEEISERGMIEVDLTD